MGLWLNHESDIDRQINRQLTYVNQSHSLASIFILHTKLIINQSVNIFKPRIYIVALHQNILKFGVHQASK